jgi:3-hydroxybutyryl-CoA dehydrogenase
MAEPSIENVSKIFIVGAGAMDSQIGVVSALAGYEVTVQDVDEGVLERPQEQLKNRMTHNVEKDRMSQEEVHAAFDKMTFSTDLDGIAANADYVIEAAVEKLDLKREIFDKLDEMVPEHTILAIGSKRSK